MASVLKQLESVPEQRELFLWKFSDVPREEVNSLMKDFMAKDVKKQGEIDPHQVLILLEHRGVPMTLTELRELVAVMDVDNNRMISFVELCCAMYKKDIGEISNFVDEEARMRALAQAMAASERQRKVEEDIQKVKEAEELAAQERAAKLERESKMTGVQGAAAFFSRKIAESADDSNQTKSNEQRIKEEAARRRVLREAKKSLEEAQAEVNRRKSAEEIAAEVKAREMRTAAEEAALKKKQEDDERAFRAARKATLNAIWSPKGDSANPATPARALKPVGKLLLSPSPAKPEPAPAAAAATEGSEQDK